MKKHNYFPAESVKYLGLVIWNNGLHSIPRLSHHKWSSRNRICVCKTWQKIVYEWEIILMNVGHDRHVCLAKNIRKCQQFSCGGTIYSCHIRVQQNNDGTGLTNNVSISQDYGVHPSHVKYLIRNSCNVFSGVLFPTGCMSNVPTRSKEWETWTLNMNMFRSA